MLSGSTDLRKKKRVLSVVQGLRASTQVLLAKQVKVARLLYDRLGKWNLSSTTSIYIEKK